MTGSFPQPERLRKQREFDAVYAGRKRTGQHICVHYIRTDSALRKAGFVVSKRVSKRAVLRNTVKRRLRELYRIHRDTLPRGMHIVIRALPSAAFAAYAELADDFLAIVERIASKTPSDRTNQIV